MKTRKWLCVILFERFVCNLLMNLYNFIYFIKIQLIKEKNEKGLEAEILNETETISKNKNIFIEHAINLANAGIFSWQDVEDEANVIVFGVSKICFNRQICIEPFFRLITGFRNNCKHDRLYFDVSSNASTISREIVRRDKFCNRTST